jgi:O-antigen ligase
MPRTVTVALTLVCADVNLWTTAGPQYRYFPIFFALMVAIAFDLRRFPVRRSNFANCTAFAAILYSSWLLLLLAAALLDNEWAPNTLVVVAVPVLMGVVGLGSILQLESSARRNTKFWDRSVYLSATLFAALSLLEVTVLEKPGHFHLLSHEKTFIAIFILCLPHRKKFWLVKFIMLAALLVSIISYPSATTVAAIIGAAFVALLLKYSRGIFANAVVIVALLACVTFVQSLEDALGDFYAAVGRTDNTQTRLYLWQQAIPVVLDDPLFGGAARASITGIANINGVSQAVPFHNSLLTLLVVGGGIAVFLLASVLALISMRILSEKSRIERNISMQWLPPLVAGLGTFAVNPVIDSLGSALFFYVVLCLGLVQVTRAVGSVRRNAEDHPVAGDSRYRQQKHGRRR